MHDKYRNIIKIFLTWVFWVIAKANSSSGAVSSGVILAPPGATLYPPVLLMVLDRPPIEQLLIELPPMVSRFPVQRKKEKNKY